MTIFFAFSDEAGDYQQNRDVKYCIRNPFYVRATLVTKADNWLILKNNINCLKKQFQIPPGEEIKWSYLWLLHNYESRGIDITPDKPFYFLKDIGYQGVLDFIQKSCRLIEPEKCFIIITVSFNDNMKNFSDNDFYKFHIQDLLQRIELENDSSSDSICIIFFDSISDRKDKLFREIYHKFYLNGDFFLNYEHIKDSINFEYSHHSVGIQLADYISGCFLGVMKNYQVSNDIFDKIILPAIRSNEEGNVLGYGIMEVPTNSDDRTNIRDRINHL